MNVRNEVAKSSIKNHCCVKRSVLKLNPNGLNHEKLL